MAAQSTEHRHLTMESDSVKGKAGQRKTGKTNNYFMIESDQV